MKPDTPGAVGLLAGGGALPREIADAVAASGRDVFIVVLEGEADPATFAPHPFAVVNWGRIGAMLRAFKSRGVRDLVIVGSVTRPDLGRIRTDFGFYRNLPRILRIVAAGGDDNVLRRVVRFFEGHGFRVRGPADVAPGLVIGPGTLGRIALTPAAAVDVAHGFAVIGQLAPFDVGQAVVVRDGRVLAIEGAEGTDRMVQRVAPTVQPEGLLVKRPKPGQELRVDMPAIGPRTVVRVAEAGLAGIAVEAGVTLAAARADLIRAADDQGIFVAGIAAGDAAPQPTSRGKFRLAQKRPPGEEDAAIGQALLRAISGSVGSRGAIAVRRHVLAIETGEGLRALVARAAGLRQWGRHRFSRRRGALTVAQASDLDLETVVAAGEAGLACIAIAIESGASTGLSPDMARAAQAAGVRVISLPESADGGSR